MLAYFRTEQNRNSFISSSRSNFLEFTLGFCLLSISDGVCVRRLKSRTGSRWMNHRMTVVGWCLIRHLYIGRQLTSSSMLGPVTPASRTSELSEAFHPCLTTTTCMSAFRTWNPATRIVSPAILRTISTVHRTPEVKTLLQYCHTNVLCQFCGQEWNYYCVGNLFSCEGFVESYV